MRIGIDAHPLSDQRRGIGNYVYNITKHLGMMDGENEYFLYSECDFELPFENHRWHKRIQPVPIFHRVDIIRWWFLQDARKRTIKDGIDIFWSTRALLPPYLPMKQVLTVYDLIWHYFPTTMSRGDFLICKLLAKKSIKRADHICSISEATAMSLEKVLHVKKSKISIVYPGSTEYHQSYCKDESAKYIADKFKTSENYILTVGTVQPRKNIEGLLKAFRVLLDDFNIDSQLLIAGGKGWQDSKIFETYKKLRFTERQVKFLGYVPDEDMPRLYSGAELFVFPSFYEGFGLPPLEAMAFGCPIITSNTSSLPEVVGDAGIMVGPSDTRGLAKAIMEVLSNKKIKNDLEQKSLERAKFFSWEKAAREMLFILSRV